MCKTVRSIERIGILLLPACLMAAGNDVIVADSRHLTGINAWWANLYNQSHLQFALLTVLMIPTAGCILGSIADFFMKRIGIDLKSRSLREG